jgi:hypothetical protein
MTIFAVLMPTPQPQLVERIRSAYNSNYYQLNDTQWLISSSGTAIDLTTKLGIADPQNLNAQPTGIAIVFATSAYYGRAPQPVWDWIKSKLESHPNA